MKHEIFEHTPGQGDYGTDWKRVMVLANKPTAMRLAADTFTREHKPLRVFTAPVRGVGRMVAEFKA